MKTKDRKLMEKTSTIISVKTLHDLIAVIAAAEARYNCTEQIIKAIADAEWAKPLKLNRILRTIKRSYDVAIKDTFFPELMKGFHGKK
jgi:hypothetical protein